MGARAPPPHGRAIAMVITESAMVCAVGHTAASACAAKRACLSGFGELPFRDGAGEPVIGAPVAILEWTLPRSSRLLAMLGMALEELLHQCAGSQWERVALLVCLAEPGRPGWNAELADFIIPLLQEQLGVTFHRTASRVLNAGPTGAFEALRVAHEALAVSNVGACVVCGVDSFIDAATLRWLDGHYRLKTAANRDGLIPGEAAAAVLVRAAQAPDAGVEVAGLGFGIEAAHLLSGEPLLAHGLTTAVREALEQANVGLHEIDLRLSYVTGARSADDGRDQARAFFGLIPASRVADEVRDDRAGYAEQHRDQDASAVFTRHHELRESANNETDDESRA